MCYLKRWVSNNKFKLIYFVILNSHPDYVPESLTRPDCSLRQLNFKFLTNQCKNQVHGLVQIPQNSNLDYGWVKCVPSLFDYFTMIYWIGIQTKTPQSQPWSAHKSVKTPSVKTPSPKPKQSELNKNSVKLTMILDNSIPHMKKQPCWDKTSCYPNALERISSSWLFRG